MKKLLLAAAAVLFASTASATISGSSHDFTGSSGFGGGTSSSCAYCHMPHFGKAGAVAPLWARNLAPSSTYTLYSSVSGGQKASAIGAGSAACLSCHDGTQAVAQVVNFGYGATGNTTVPGATNTTVKLTNTSSAFIGTNLMTEHPVSVVYNTALNGNYAGLTTSPPAAFGITNGSTNIECTSCHNAHNSKIAGSSYPNRQFMVNYTGDFCSACHSQK